MSVFKYILDRKMRRFKGLASRCLTCGRYLTTSILMCRRRRCIDCNRYIKTCQALLVVEDEAYLR